MSPLMEILFHGTVPQVMMLKPALRGAWDSIQHTPYSQAWLTRLNVVVVSSIAKCKDYNLVKYRHTSKPVRNNIYKHIFTLLIERACTTLVSDCFGEDGTAASLYHPAIFGQ